MIQRKKYSLTFSIHKVILTCLGGARTRCIITVDCIGQQVRTGNVCHVRSSIFIST